MNGIQLFIEREGLWDLGITVPGFHRGISFLCSLRSETFASSCHLLGALVKTEKPCWFLIEVHWCLESSLSRGDTGHARIWVKALNVTP